MVPVLIPEKLQSYFGAEKIESRMNTNIVGRFCETPTKDWRPPRRTPYNLFVSICFHAVRARARR